MANNTFPSGISRRPLPAELARDLSALFEEIAQAQAALAKQMTRTTRIINEKAAEKA